MSDIAHLVRWRPAAAYLGAGLLLICAGSALAQPVPQAKPIPEDQSATEDENSSRIKILLRTTLIALNHANRTGNYAVLRDLGTPEFKTTYTPADLAAAFAKIREQKVDLSPIAVVDPVYKTPIPIDEKGVLKIDGHFPTQTCPDKFFGGFSIGGWKMANGGPICESQPGGGPSRPGRIKLTSPAH